MKDTNHMKKIIQYKLRIYVTFTLIISSICHHYLEAYKYNLSICAIFQQEGPYLKEWIEFHKLVGVQHFYLYNNFSMDNFRQVLEPYIRDGEVELFDWPIYAKPNDATWVISAYNHALTAARGKTQWLAFLDLDEFLFPIQKYTITDFLKNYDNYGGLCVNWVMFGTGNVKKIPTDGLIIEHLLLRAPHDHAENLVIKSIIQPHNVISILNQHCAKYRQGYFQVTADKKRFEGPFAPVIALDKIRINHYWSRDEYFFHNVKIPRRLLDMGERKEICIKRNNTINKVLDTAIHKYLPPLKTQLKL